MSSTLQKASRQRGIRAVVDRESDRSTSEDADEREVDSQDEEQADAEWGAGRGEKLEGYEKNYTPMPPQAGMLHIRQRSQIP